MAKAHSKTLLAFGDVHIPHQNPRAMEVFCRAAERLRRARDDLAARPTPGCF